MFLPGKFHGQRSLMGYSPWGCRVRHDSPSWGSRGEMSCGTSLGSEVWNGPRSTASLTKLWRVVMRTQETVGWGIRSRHGSPSYTCDPPESAPAAGAEMWWWEGPLQRAQRKRKPRKDLEILLENVFLVYKLGQNTGLSEVESVSCSVMSDSLWSHGLQSTRLLCPWDFPGKNIGVGCHFLL